MSRDSLRRPGLGSWVTRFLTERHSRPIIRYEHQTGSEIMKSPLLPPLTYTDHIDVGVTETAVTEVTDDIAIT